MVNARALKIASVLFGIFGALRLAATSGIPSLRNAVTPYAPLEYALLFGAVYLWFYGLSTRPRLSLIIAVVAVVVYFVVSTGAGF